MSAIKLAFNIKIKSSFGFRINVRPRIKSVYVIIRVLVSLEPLILTITDDLTIGGLFLVLNDMIRKCVHFASCSTNFLQHFV